MTNVKNQRKNLWEKDPCCFWCGDKTILIYSETGILPPNAATIDHIRNRKSLARRIPTEIKESNKEIVVLACYRCNQLRSKAEEWFYNQVYNEMIKEMKR